MKGICFYGKMLLNTAVYHANMHKNNALHSRVTKLWLTLKDLLYRFQADS